MSPEVKTQAEKTLAVVYRRWMDAGSNIDILHELSQRDVGQLRESAATSAEATLEYLRRVLPYVSPLMASPEAATIFRQLSERSVENYLLGIRASRLVFWHSVLDGIAFDLVELTATLAPEGWDGRVDQKTVTLSKVRHTDYGALRSEAIRKILKDEIDRGSLPSKIEILCDVASMDSTRSLIVDYNLDLNELRRVDGLRIQLVHGKTSLADTARNVTDADVDYLRTTASYLIVSVARKFGIHVALGDVFPGVAKNELEREYKLL
jgi:hypothetical protein